MSHSDDSGKRSLRGFTNDKLLELLERAHREEEELHQASASAASPRLKKGQPQTSPSRSSPPQRKEKEVDAAKNIKAAEKEKEKEKERKERKRKKERKRPPSSQPQQQPSQSKREETNSGETDEDESDEHAKEEISTPAHVHNNNATKDNHNHNNNNNKKKRLQVKNAQRPKSWLRNWSDWEERLQSEAVKKDPLARLLLTFPPNPIVVARLPRDTSALPEELSLQQLREKGGKAWEYACIEAFSKPWTYLRRKERRGPLVPSTSAELISPRKFVQHSERRDTTKQTSTSATSEENVKRDEKKDNNTNKEKEAEEKEGKDLLSLLQSKSEELEEGGGGGGSANSIEPRNVQPPSRRWSTETAAASAKMTTEECDAEEDEDEEEEEEQTNDNREGEFVYYEELNQHKQRWKRKKGCTILPSVRTVRSHSNTVSGAYTARHTETRGGAHATKTDLMSSSASAVPTLASLPSSSPPFSTSSVTLLSAQAGSRGSLMVYRSPVESEPFAPPLAQRLLVTCQEISFASGKPFEPLFYSLSLHDLFTRKRISESFYFDYNDQTFKEGLLAASSSSSGSKNTIAKQTEVHKAMFTVHNPSSSIYLVLRAERLFFDGKLDKDNTEKHFYVKPKVCKGKGLKEIEKTVSQAIANYKGEWGSAGMPLRPFAFAFIPIFGDNLSLRDHNPPTTPSSTSPSSSSPPSTSIAAASCASTVGPAPASSPSYVSFDALSGTPSSPSIESPKIGLSSCNVHLDQLIPVKPGMDVDDESIYDIITAAAHKTKQQGNASSIVEAASTIKGKKGSNMAKKNVLATIKLNIQVLGTDDRREMAPSILHPHSLLPREVGEPALLKMKAEALIKEVASFEPRIECNSSYTHVLYLYPTSLRCFPCTNVLIEVSLQESDHQQQQGLPVFYGRSSSSLFTTLAKCVVHSKDKEPNLYDEIKLKLPPRLHEGHHLLFSFYQLHALKKDKEKEETGGKTLLGRAFLPLLLSEARLLDNGSLTLTVTKDLQPGYLKQHQQHYNNAKGEGGKKLKGGVEEKGAMTFSLNVVALSSLYPQNDALSRFWRIFRMPSKTSMLASSSETSNNKVQSRPILHTNETPSADQAHAELEALEALRKVPVATLLQHLPVILNELFHTLASTTSEANKQAAFATIITILNGVRSMASGTSKEARDFGQLLHDYAVFMFDNMADSAPSYVYEEVCKYWLQLLNQADKKNVLAGFSDARFLLDIITKSMTLKITCTGEIEKDNTRTSRFSKEHSQRLVKLMRKLFSGAESLQSLDSLYHFSATLQNLFGIMDRGLVCNMVYTFMEEAKDVRARLASFKFLQTFLDIEDYIPLNIPLPPSLNYLDVPGLIDDFWKRHFLSGLLLHEIEKSLNLDSAASQTQAIITLRNLLKKHETDSRCKKERAKARVVSLYFPFLLILVDNPVVIYHQLDKPSRLIWLTCFIYILQNCSRELLCGWWKKETQSRQLSFLRLLNFCLQVFKEEDNEEAVYIAALDVLVDFMHNFEEELCSPSPSVLMPRVLSIMNGLFQLEKANYLLECLYPALRWMVHTFREALFRFSTNYNFCEMLCCEVMYHCTWEDAQVRQKASSLFYLLLKNNWQEMKNVTRMKIQCTVAVSRLVGGTKGTLNLNRLQESFQNIEQMAQQTNDKALTDITAFQSEIKEVMSRVMKLVTYSSKIAENVRDPETTADLFHKISLNYNDTPDIRVRWLENLSDFQASQNNPEEAGQCKLHIAALVAQYLQRGGELPSSIGEDPLRAFIRMAPNVPSDAELPQETESSTSSAYQDPQLWSITGIIKLLSSAAQLLEEAKTYETCMEVLMLLSNIHMEEKDYTALTATLEKFKAMTQTLIAANKDIRIFPTYYRVGFYGKKFEELQNKEFIYRVPGQTKLEHIQNQLKEKHAKKVGGQLDNIVILQSNDMDVTQLEQNSEKLYIQLCCVEPYILPSRIEKCSSPHEKHFDIQHFIFEAGYSASGKNVAKGGLAEQQKKKTIYMTNHSFPYIKNRLAVVESSQIILSPLENAIELMEGRVSSLRAQLSANPPKLNSLQSVIQGSVVTMVNEGPMAICEVFLSDESLAKGKSDPKYNSQLERLQEKMDEFVKMCGFAIALNKSLISAEHIPFQKMVENKYDQLKAAAAVYLQKPLL